MALSRLYPRDLFLALALLAFAPQAALAQAPPPAAPPTGQSPAAETPVEEEAPEGPAEIPVDALLKANGGLPDIVLGNADAKVTVVEYASLSCSHCADFHNKVLPEVKAKYLDTGKAKLILREFPTSNRGLVAALLTRCAPPDNAPALIDKLFETQEEWAFGEADPKPKLKEISLANGLTEEKFESCLKDQALYEKLVQTFSAAGERFGINATPTIFVQGKRLPEASLEAFDKAMTEAK